MPNNWTPRPHQLPALRALDDGCKRALLLWHRRAGKDAMTLNWIAKEMARQPMSALYLLPEFKQAKRVIFRELDPITGKTHIDQAFPEALRAGPPNKTEGTLNLWNGSLFQIGGFDTIDSYLGIGPKVVVFSEWAISPHAPRAWQLVLPMLLMNGGIAIFPYTPRGKNHGKTLLDTAEATPWMIGSEDASSWFVSKQTIDDTKLVPPEVIRREIESGSFTEDYARQEFWLSFEAPNSGSYYGRLMERAEQEGRITEVPWRPGVPVETWWDIGVDDATVIWFVQVYRNGQIGVIDYIESEGEALPYYLGELEKRRMMGWVFAANGQRVPHDFSHRTFQTGESPMMAARKMGWRMTGVPLHPIEDRIDATRRILPRCWFDKTRCAAGVAHLREYRKKWSEQLQQFLGPLHDGHSHAADAFGVGVMGLKDDGFRMSPNVSQAEHAERMIGRQVEVVTSYNEFA